MSTEIIDFSKLLEFEVRGFVVTSQCNPFPQCVTVHPVPKFRSCHKAIMVTTGRAHCYI